MSKYRQAARTDDNQKELVRQLRQCGVSVETRHDDILCGYHGRTYWLELKNPNRPPSARKLTKAEQLRADNWRGQYDVVTTLDEALAVVFERTVP